MLQSMVNMTDDEDGLFGGDILVGTDLIRDMITKNDAEGGHTSMNFTANIIQINDLFIQQDLAWKEISIDEVRYYKTTDILDTVDMVGLKLLYNPDAEPMSYDHISLKPVRPAMTNVNACYNFQHGSICLTREAFDSIGSRGSL